MKSYCVVTFEKNFVRSEGKRDFTFFISLDFFDFLFGMKGFCSSFFWTSGTEVKQFESSQPSGSSAAEVKQLLETAKICKLEFLCFFGLSSVCLFLSV